MSPKTFNKNAIYRSFKMLLLGSALLGGGILAQDEFSETVGEATMTPEENGTNLPARTRAQLSPEQQKEQAIKIKERAEGISKKVSSMLDEARRENDVLRVTCLNDKLTQINTNMKTLESRLSGLEDAINIGNASRRDHEFTIITVVNGNISELDQAASLCVGEDMFETRSTRVITTIDSRTTSENSNQPPKVVTVPTPVVFPPCLSEPCR